MATVRPEEQRELALHVLKRLRDAGYQALWAGGCVRDQLLKRVPNDYDVATSATPTEIRDLFGHRHTLAIGAAFGVVAVLGKKHAGMVEVSTFRRDAEYSDGRHPDAVVFSTAEEDAQRRDFTINGLFYDPLDEQVIDYVGGMADIEARIVRAIGDPRARFSEDKLRMIRAVRMAASFDFALDPATHAAVHEMADTINVVSPERIAQEMRKILVHPRRAAAVELLRTTRLLAVLLPELLSLRAGSSKVDLWQHTQTVLTSLDGPSFPLALAALVHALSPSASWPAGAAITEAGADRARITAETIGDRWRLSNKEREQATWLLAHRSQIVDAAQKPWSSVQPLLVAPDADELIALVEAEASAWGEESRARAAANAQFCRGRRGLPPEELNPAPLLSGNDLARHGVPKGPVYRWLLDQIRAAQLDAKIKNRDEALARVDRLLLERGNRPDG